MNNNTDTLKNKYIKYYDILTKEKGILSKAISEGSGIAYNRLRNLRYKDTAVVRKEDIKALEQAFPILINAPTKDDVIELLIEENKALKQKNEAYKKKLNKFGLIWD